MGGMIHQLFGYRGYESSGNYMYICIAFVIFLNLTDSWLTVEFEEKVSFKEAEGITIHVDRSVILSSVFGFTHGGRNVVVQVFSSISHVVNRPGN